MVYDLPGSGKRLIQRARGYVATVKSGVVVREHDEATGARPGRLLRGPQPQPVPIDLSQGGPAARSTSAKPRTRSAVMRVPSVSKTSRTVRSRPAEVHVDVDRHAGPVDEQRSGFGPEVLEHEGVLGVVAKDVLVPGAAVPVHVEHGVRREQPAQQLRGPGP